jgi:hypothetical protein
MGYILRKRVGLVTRLINHLPVSPPEDILALLDNEAMAETRDRSNMLRHILNERYRKQPRLEEKLTAGSLRKDV